MKHPLWFGMLAMIAGLCACSRQEAPKPPDAVTVQLKWVHQAQFAGLYVAEEKGYFAEEGLKVGFLEGGQGIDSAQALISGQADFAVITPEDILIRRSQGAAIVSIAAIYRRSAVVYLSVPGTGIIRPSDFAGKTVAITGRDGAVRDLEFQFYALMKKLGVPLDAVRCLPYDPDYTAFIRGDTDITAAFLTAGVVKLRQQGYSPNIIWPGDYGIHFYSDTLATTETMITQNPDRVTRFLRAALKGWREAVGDPESAVAIILKYAILPDFRLQTAMMDAQIPLIHTGSGPIGWMEPDIWQGMYQVLMEQGLIAASVDVRSAYSMAFLKSIYEGGVR
ncbi:MAG: ABC transporter substrate-binding protein [Pseudomonadota bacterium]